MILFVYIEDRMERRNISASWGDL